MAGGLFALLDDVAAIAKTAAASLDDVAAGAAKASVKSAGVIIDDAAVSPQYVENIPADRELGIVGRIALGSIRNKLLIIIPVALLLSQFAEWALPILLLVGGSFLAFEGAEKVLAWVGLGHDEHPNVVDSELEPHDDEERDAREDKVVFGAVRTDLILSTEIMLISLSNIDTDSFWLRLGILLAVAILMTVGVYGAVALLVRMDDLGLRLAAGSRKWLHGFGRGLVAGMPKLLAAITVIGTLAMLWVGGHLIVANLEEVGAPQLYDGLHGLEHMVEHAGGFVTWTVDTAYSAVCGLVAGLIIVGILTLVKRLIPKKAKGAVHA